MYIEIIVICHDFQHYLQLQRLYSKIIHTVININIEISSNLNVNSAL
jgi:hypothetical protein